MTPAERRRRSGQVTRRLRMLRAHGLIKKVPHTHRYLVTEQGRQVVTALMAAREADAAKLAKAA
jgi:DNA-binding HxlR family transcriptional regulator